MQSGTEIRIDRLDPAGTSGGTLSAPAIGPNATRAVIARHAVTTNTF